MKTPVTTGIRVRQSDDLRFDADEQDGGDRIQVGLVTADGQHMAPETTA